MSEDPDPAVRGDRFSGGPARGFLSSLETDERIFGADLAVDRAHVVMLAEQGIVDGTDAGAILAALAAVEDAGHSLLPEGEDVHEAIESAVIERAGEVGGRMHTARSRNDEVATCIRYRFREDLLDAVEATLRLREALAEAGAAHVETVAPGYTHLQPAQPVTLGHHLLSYEQSLRRDTGRLLDAYGRTNRSPLGAAAFAGTSFEVDRARTAELLGFDAVLENSMDAVTARDFLLEGVGTLATLAATLSGLAEDLVLYSHRGFVELDDDYASTSSIMPQKKNPDAMELVRATAGEAAGALQGMLTTLKGLPRSYNRDLQRADPHAWRAVDEVTEATAVAAGAVATADWDVSALSAASGDGFSTATGVADLLAQGGVPFRQAHQVLARVARRATRERSEEDGAGANRADDASDGANGGDDTPDHANGADDAPEYDELDAAAREVLGEPLSEFVDRAAVEAALDPAESVASRSSTGGPAPDAVAEQLDAAEASLAEDRSALADEREALAAADEALAAAVAEYR